MSRWALPLLILVCACGWIFVHRGHGHLLADTDTAVALRTIEARHNPLSWFVTDWPLENHFYRPLPTLSLALDQQLYGNHDEGFGATNALLCIFGVLGLFWFVYELTESPGLAAACTLLMSAWLTTGAETIAAPFDFIAIGALLIGIFRHRAKWRIYVPIALLLFYAGNEIRGLGPGAGGNADLAMRTVGWIPGRTATIMTVFAMIALAAYVRLERLGAHRDPQPTPTPLDLPATRTSVQYPVKRFAQWPWAAISFLSATLAFASYEQAVMLPAVLLGTAILLRTKGVRVRWAWHGVYWALIPAYLLLRHAIMPSTVSRYQGQQLRFGASVFNDLLSTIFPGSGGLEVLYGRLDVGPTLLLDLSNYVLAIFFVANAVSLWKTRQRWQWTTGILILSFLAYLPMAWLKYFGHYIYWSSMMRSLYVVCLVWMGLEGLISVVSPQAQQAPPRPNPAPGSLLHP